MQPAPFFHLGTSSKDRQPNARVVLDRGPPLGHLPASVNLQGAAVSGQRLRQKSSVPCRPGAAALPRARSALR